MNQDWLDGYQAALEDLAAGLPNGAPGIGLQMGAVLWSKDPAVHAAAVARFDARLDSIRSGVVGSAT